MRVSVKRLVVDSQFYIYSIAFNRYKIYGL